RPPKQATARSSSCRKPDPEIHRATRRIPRRVATSVAALILLLGAATPAAAQQQPQDESPPWSLDLTIHDFGIGIGNSRRINGVRLNFRDLAPFTVRGINATIWMPEEGGGGDVYGLALGLPATGARRSEERRVGNECRW